MRISNIELVKRISNEYALPGPIYDIGGAGFRSMWNNIFPEFKTVDILPDSDITADICSMPQINSDSIGTVVTMDTFEHIKEPWKAVDEIYRILRPGGILIISTVLIWDYHEYPQGTPDYWRFTASCLDMLCSKFEKIESGYSKEDVPIDDKYIQASKSGSYFIGRKGK